METAVIYTRVSTEEQAVMGVSLEAQAERLEAYCKVHDLEVLAVTREEESGSKPLASRPGGKDVLDLISTGGVRHVVALKLDRLFRDAVDALTQTKEWDKKGVSLHLIDMGVDTSAPIGRFFLNVMAGFAELERSLIAERTATALRYKKSQRQAYSPTPYGYDRRGDTLHANPKEQAALRDIRALRADGKSLRKIAAELVARGIPTKRGGKWHAGTLKYMLKNSYQEAA
jgi:site-specific DNA recombinase